MTDKQAALAALIAAIEAGDDISWGIGGSPARKGLPTLWETALNAYCGSLDAALALHDALLPGWAWSIGSDNAAEVWPFGKVVDAIRAYTDGGSPARAWLVAILKAYQAQLAEVA